MEIATEVTEQDRSFDSLESNEKEANHYNDESDNEPPTDQIGDLITIIKKRQVTKRILYPGNNLGKPGRPFTVIISLKAYFASKSDDPVNETP